MSPFSLFPGQRASVRGNAFHVAPTGLKNSEGAVFYKHVVPTGLAIRPLTAWYRRAKYVSIRH
jgi:hypothetical protein